MPAPGLPRPRARLHARTGSTSRSRTNRTCTWCSAQRRRLRGVSLESRASRPRAARAGELADHGRDQVEEVTVDPVAREFIGDGENELALGDLGGFDLPEP